jgi:hypothetical protein
MMFFAEYNALRCGKEKERKGISAIGHQQSAQARLLQRPQQLENNFVGADDSRIDHTHHRRPLATFASFAVQFFLAGC